MVVSVPIRNLRCHTKCFCWSRRME